MWPFNLSVRLPIVALVGRYLTNQLIGREAISKRIAPFPSEPCGPVGLCGISSRFQLLSPSLRQVPHALLTRSPLNTEKINPPRIPFDLHVLGAPPAFVLSQDQTLYKMIFITLKVLNLVHSARNRLRPVNYSLEFLSVPYTLKVPLQVFDIVQFSRSCAVRLAADSLFILPRSRELVKHFFEAFFEVRFGFVAAPWSARI